MLERLLAYLAAALLVGGLCALQAENVKRDLLRHLLAMDHAEQRQGARHE